ncbi:hypothetical protein PIB30_041152 [Stylosanthes scabra]|uniref:Uncharacterized protein n=1 Tax=Stylosanthes scabra TaxID=79078 RepID=A0ABU6TGQ7_9FABA|nr:hypothetical protein [Stylosanthes scabra]
MWNFVLTPYIFVAGAGTWIVFKVGLKSLGRCGVGWVPGQVLELSEARVYRANAHAPDEHSRWNPKKQTNLERQLGKGDEAMSSCVGLLPAPDDYLGLNPSMVHPLSNVMDPWLIQSGHVPLARTCSSKVL